MGGRTSRNKGADFERAVANLLKPIYPEARRGIGQARSAGEVADVEGTPWWVEAKRMKRCSIKAAWRQAREATDGRRILVVTKDDRRPVMASFSLNLYLLDLENRNYRDSDYDELYEILTGLQGYQVIDGDRVVTIDMDHLLKLEELRLGD